MKLILLLIVEWFLFSLPIYAQNHDERRSLIENNTGNLIYISQYIDVEGSQFLYDKWLTSKVELNNGVVFRDVQLKFDICANKFIINKNDTAYEINPTANKVWLYPQILDTSTALLFENGFEINSKINSRSYLQVLAEGKITFLKFLKKDLESYTEYGNATLLKRFHEAYQYIIYKNEQYENVRLSKKDLENIFSDKWPEMSLFLIKNNLSGKDEKSWIEFLKFYSSKNSK